jgi:hypothetical protein
MLKTFANGSIEYFIDRNRSLVFGRWAGDFRGDELLACLPALWREHPEIGLWDAIHDMMDFVGFLEHRYTCEMIQLRAELVPGFNPQVRSAIVTADPMKSFEIKVTKASAPDRHFGVFASNAEALRWMARESPDHARNGPLPWWLERRKAANPAGIR